MSGLRQPVAVVHCGDGSQRLFVLEREGIVRILNHDLELIKEPFLDIHKLVQSGLKVRNELVPNSAWGICDTVDVLVARF